MAGQRVCRMHGGKAPAALANGERRVARERLESGELGRMLEQYQDEARSLSSAQKLERALDHAFSMQSALQEIVSQLGVPGVGDVVAGSGAVYGLDHLGDAKPHVAVVMLRDWTQTVGTLSKAAADIGLEERKAELVEGRAQLLVAGMQAFAAAFLALVRSQHPAGLPAFVEASLVEELPALMAGALQSGLEGGAG